LKEKLYVQYNQCLCFIIDAPVTSPCIVAPPI